MKRMLSGSLAAVSLAVAALASAGSVELLPDESQLAAPIENVSVDGETYFCQVAQGEVLLLTPNHVFFDGSGLVAQDVGEPEAVGGDLNKHRSYASLIGFDELNSAVWYLYIPKSGEAQVSFEGAAGAGLAWACDGKIGALPGTITFDRTGIHKLSVTGSGEVKLKSLRLEGQVCRGAGVVRTRWRPAAAHTRFSSSKLKGESLVWIMELDAAPGAASFYSPMTTPFGYFGSSWTVEGRPSGLNFSMWSYGKSEEVPPVSQFSHLLAVGHPDASFGGFGHEGTGVKVRDWNPFEDWEGDSAVYALRFEPGADFDTYHGYYFDELQERWRLFASGRKPASDKTSLWAGSFVEVPGPPNRQRTGHIERTMRYRGSTMDGNGKWSAFDTMKGESGEWNNRQRWIDDRGRFVMSMGGMAQYGPNLELVIEKPKLPDEIWMQPRALADLMVLPTEVSLGMLGSEKDEASLEFTIRGLGKDAQATLYFGPEDGVTFADLWKGRLELSDLKEGMQKASFPLAEGTRFVRLLVENNAGRFWSQQTAVLE